MARSNPNKINDKYIVERVMEYIVKKANSEKKIIDYAKKATEGETRIAQIQIIDIDKKYWLAFDGEHIIRLGSHDSPTTIFIMDSSTFLSIILGKISPLRAIYMGLVQVDGEYWMRDLALFERGVKMFLGDADEDSSWRKWVSGGD